MFDLSIAEIGVIGVVALLVLGPERLPKAARTLGFYVRKARQSWFAVRSEFERELAAEELKRSLKLDEVHATLQDTARELRSDVAAAGVVLGAAVAEAQSSVQAVTGADPLPAALTQSVAQDAAVGAPNDAFDDQGLTPEEIARQSEPESPLPADLLEEPQPTEEARAGQLADSQGLTPSTPAGDDGAADQRSGRE